jgi:hypothetical protein
MATTIYNRKVFVKPTTELQVYPKIKRVCEVVPFTKNHQCSPSWPTFTQLSVNKAFAESESKPLFLWANKTSFDKILSDKSVFARSNFFAWRSQLRSSVEVLIPKNTEFCRDKKKSKCLMAGHNDHQAGILGDALSGWFFCLFVTIRNAHEVDMRLLWCSP